MLSFQNSFFVKEVQVNVCIANKQSEKEQACYIISLKLSLLFLRNDATSTSNSQEMIELT